MRWRGRRESDNVEDRRGTAGKVLVGGGLGATVLALIVYFLGGDPSQVLNQNAAPQQTSGQQSAQDDEAKKFVSVVLADTEDIWTKLFSQIGYTYEKPRMVLFSEYVQSACGNASAASGPFYCPGDSKVYIDLSFYNELKNRFNAPGDFAMAYVIAHEIGHHVQNQLGISDKVQTMRERARSEEESNALSVRLELQADFFAGIWAHYEEKLNKAIEVGDIDEALNAANAIGDDRLQKQSQGYVVPDAFTHGSSAQRMYWFKKGYQTGDLDQGDTFSATEM